MPIVKPIQVVSFSSEDPNHPASNLLKGENFRKWKCKEPGEAEPYVILKFEQAITINSIDIGNEHSAFIQVSVARSGNDKNNFEVLLPNTAFMSPSESRNSEKPSRVRFFGLDKLDPAIAAQKWDLVKVSCNQVFNRHVQCGIAFVNLHTPPDPNEKKKIGIFNLRKPLVDDEDDYGTGSVGSLFRKYQSSLRKEEPLGLRGDDEKKESPDPSSDPSSKKRKLNSDEAIPSFRCPSLEVQPSALFPSNSSKTTKGISTTGRINPSPGSSTISKNPMKIPPSSQLSKSVKNSNSSPAASNSSKSVNTAKSVNSSFNSLLSSVGKGSDNGNKTSKLNNGTNPSASPASNTKVPKKAKKKRKVPFEELMSGVVFCISGFENPLRSHLRDKAVEMGAKYRGDWNRTSTHLICAFANTPKFREVRNSGHGIIVKKDWIEHSYANRARLPWRRYYLDRNDAGTESESEVEAEEEVEEDEETPSVPRPLSGLEDKKSGETKAEKSPKEKSSQPEESAKPEEAEKCVKAEKAGEKNMANVEKKKAEKCLEVEGFFERGMTGKKKRSGVIESDEEEDPYNAETDVDEDEEKSEDVEEEKLTANETNDSPVDQTKNEETCGMFKNMCFFIYPSTKSKERKSVEEFVRTESGVFENELTEDVEYVIVFESEWQEEFSEGLSDNPNLTFVGFEWIGECRRAGRLLSFASFMMTPN